MRLILFGGSGAFSVWRCLTPATAFPNRSVITRAYEQELESEEPITKSPDFVDGGCDFNVDADTSVRRWVVRYGVLTASERNTLIAQRKSSKYHPEKGSALGFDFVDRDGVTHAGVRYAPGGFRYTHTKTHINQIEIVLVDYPS